MILSAYAILGVLLGLTFWKPRISLYLFILGAPLLSVYQEFRFDPRVAWAGMLGVRAWMPAGPGGRPINFRIAIAVAIFFALSAAVLALREDTIPPDDARSAWIFAACLLTGALFAFAASRFLGNEADAIRAVFFLGVSELVVALFAFWQAYHLFIDDG